MYLGVKVTGGRPTGESAIVVHVVRKKTLGELTRDDLSIPRVVEDRIETAAGESKVVQIPTDVVEVGEPQLYRNDGHQRPCPGGFQIQAEWSSGTGTLGVNMKWGKGSPYRLISNNHVIAGNDGKNKGKWVYQPDYNGPPTQLAKLTDFVPIVTYPHKGIEDPTYNLYDLAWCTIDKKRGSPVIHGIGEPKGWRQPEVGARVRMMGAETGKLVEANITSVEYVWVYEKWPYPAMTIAFFERLILLDRPIAQAGDSGAALVDDDGYVVGLCMGGAKVNTIGCRLF
jgi:hypothetical protein